MNSKTEQSSYILIDRSELQKLKADIVELKELIMDKKHEFDFLDQYIESKQIPKLLSISSRTWQVYRFSGEIPFIQIGHKIWVKRKDLDAFMDKNRITKKIRGYRIKSKKDYL